jgi:hypothetical protein
MSTPPLIPSATSNSTVSSNLSGLLYDTVSIQTARRQMVGSSMNDEREKIRKEAVVTCSSRVLICPWKDCENHERPSVRIAGVPGEIRTEDLLNTVYRLPPRPPARCGGQVTSVRPSGSLLAMTYSEPLNCRVGSDTVQHRGLPLQSVAQFRLPAMLIQADGHSLVRLRARPSQSRYSRPQTKRRCT